jgi:hypothetical protein
MIERRMYPLQSTNAMMVTNFAGTPATESCGLTGARRFSNFHENGFCPSSMRRVGWPGELAAKADITGSSTPIAETKTRRTLHAIAIMRKLRCDSSKLD